MIAQSFSTLLIAEAEPLEKWEQKSAAIASFNKLLCQYINSVYVLRYVANKILEQM